MFANTTVSHSQIATVNVPDYETGLKDAALRDLETRTAIGQLMIDNLSHHFARKPLLTPVI